jgi:DNA-binding NarL/FixJ family response regulator
MRKQVVLVEDYVAFRESFRAALAVEDDFDVVGEASNAHDAPSLIETTSPDLLVLDFLLPDGNAISLTRDLKRRGIKVPTLILGRIANSFIAQEALRQGISGFVNKDASLDVVLEAMRKVCSGGRYFADAKSDAHSDGTSDTAETRSRDSDGFPLRELSQREREVLFLLIEGQSSKQIGTALFLSRKTVDAHRLHINRKLGVRSPAALQRLAAAHNFFR